MDTATSKNRSCCSSCSVVVELVRLTSSWDCCPLQVLFRSVNKLLMDTATSEYLFCCDFFQEDAVFHELFAATLGVVGALPSSWTNLPCGKEPCVCCSMPLRSCRARSCDKLSHFAVAQTPRASSSLSAALQPLSHKGLQRCPWHMCNHFPDHEGSNAAQSCGRAVLLLPNTLMVQGITLLHCDNKLQQGSA